MSSQDKIRIQKISCLNIEKFRHLENLNKIKIGDKLTIISGENGTGKSTILGLIGHIFAYRGKNVRSIDNRLFQTQFSEVFRFSPTKDFGNEHKYSLTFEDGTIKEAESRFIAGENRFRIDVGKRLHGKGKITKPVLYLGLRRLFPLAQEKERSINFKIEDKLTNEEKLLFKEWHNKILVMDDDVDPKPTKTRNKQVYSPTTTKYDAFGNSAGQDNVAQIILSILSLKREMENDAEQYSGGLILIDELDATLYPAAQRNILDLFLSVCRDYRLQIVFTTHSLDILEYVFSEKRIAFLHSSEIIFFHRSRGNVKIIQDIADIKPLTAELTHTPILINKNPKKVNVYFEDDEARIFFKNIIYKKYLKVINIQRNSLGGDSYVSLIENKFPEFEKSIVVLDGDKYAKFKKHTRPKVLILPGKTSPEKVILNFLNNLPESSEFWSSELGGYNKSAFIQNKPSADGNRVVMKDWFNKEKRNWGRNCSNLFKKWKEQNKPDVDYINNQLEKLLFVINK